jgi:hypothetical protein
MVSTKQYVIQSDFVGPTNKPSSANIWGFGFGTVWLINQSIKSDWVTIAVLKPWFQADSFEYHK